MTRRVVIVGASVAGVRCALALRERGFTGSVTLLESEDSVPYDKPQLSKHIGPVDKLALLVAAEEMRRHDIEFHPATSAVELDVAAHVVATAQEGFEFDDLVIATGCRPRPLLSGLPQRASYVRNRQDWERLRDAVRRGGRLIVVGAGFLGLETAAAAVRLGMQVTVLDVATRVLSRGVPEAVASTIAERHVAEGVELRLGADAPLLDGDDRKVWVDGLEGDFAVVSIGAVPNVEWLTGSGLRIDNGVVCDETLRAAPGIWAAGDCARWMNIRYGHLDRMEHWTTAVTHGQHVAASISRGQSSPLGEVPYVWSDQYDWRIQTVGRVGVRESHFVLASGGHVVISADGEIVTGITTINAQALSVRSRRLLQESDPSFDEAVEALGAGALEIIS